MTSRSLKAPEISCDMRMPLCAGVNPSKQNSKSVKKEECDSNTTRARLGRRFQNGMHYHYQQYHGTANYRKNAEKRNHSEFLANRFSSPSVGSNMLVQLCEKKCWRDAWMRCKSHPSEASPILRIQHFSVDSMHSHDRYGFRRWKREKSASDPGGSRDDGCCSGVRNDTLPVQESGENVSISDAIHYVTPLGIICQSQFDDHRMVEIIQHILHICPQQVQCNQTVKGHTPLRDAVRNNSCPPHVIKHLLEADRDMPSSVPVTNTNSSEEDGGSHSSNRAAFRPDRDGLYPIDHVIMSIYSGKATHSFETFQTFLSVYPELKYSSAYYHSNGSPPNAIHDSIVAIPPLIRLLSLGTSTTTTTQEYRLSHNPGCGLSGSNCHSITKAGRTKKVLDCIYCLLSYEHQQPGDWSLVRMLSPSTKCTPLHVAIRNHGDVLPLIQLLVDRDPRQLSKRNHFGDLPIHVATSVGVPTDVLCLLVESTVAATASAIEQSSSPPVSSRPHPLLWSANNAGNTPIDLEWMRHIESGYGFRHRRCFYPVPVHAFNNNSSMVARRQHHDNKTKRGTTASFYREILEEAIQDVVAEATGPTNIHQNHKDEEESSFLQPSESSSLQAQQEGQQIGVKAKTIIGEALLERIIYIMLQAAAHATKPSSCTMHKTRIFQEYHIHNDKDEIKKKSCKNKTSTKQLRSSEGGLILHAASAMLTRSSSTTTSDRAGDSEPHIPLPLLRLFLKLYPTQVLCRDEMGRLPLHYSLMIMGGSTSSLSLTRYNSTRAPPSTLECIEWIQLLLGTAPRSASVADINLRLPLHYALDCDGGNQPLFALEDTHDNNGKKEEECFAAVESSSPLVDNNNKYIWDEQVVWKLVDAFPDALERKDPKTRLYPFMQAATRQNSSITTVFGLLRQSPSLCINK